MTHLRRLRPSLLLAAIAIASLRCSSDSSDPVNQPGSVVEVSGNGQVGLINEALPQPLDFRGTRVPAQQGIHDGQLDRTGADHFERFVPGSGIHELEPPRASPT